MVNEQGLKPVVSCLPVYTRKFNILHFDFGIRYFLHGRECFNALHASDKRKDQMQKLKKHFSTIFFAAVLIAGLAIFLYPSVSNYINNLNSSKAISEYNEAMAGLSEKDYEECRKAAEAYNKALTFGITNFNLSDEEMENYNSILDPTGTGIIGYLEIENIGVNLPIYHGVEESVLAVGIGHIPGSSFPIGGKSTHSVLSGHRGLPSAKLLSDLDQMVEGDNFLIHIMGQTYAYKVDQINIVLPEETDALAVVEGKDYVTLVTCTPYGVNTHRLLVRGTRVDYDEETRLLITADATVYPVSAVAPFIGGILLAIIFVIFLIRTSRFFRK
jgi:sortase A